LYEKYAEYAILIANQGKLEVAWRFLELIPDDYAENYLSQDIKEELLVMKDRIYHGGGYLVATGLAPLPPFEVQPVQDEYQYEQQQLQVDTSHQNAQYGQSNGASYQAPSNPYAQVQQPGQWDTQNQQQQYQHNYQHNQYARPTQPPAFEASFQNQPPANGNYYPKNTGNGYASSFPSQPQTSNGIYNNPQAAPSVPDKPMPAIPGTLDF
jgi:protein transport protein SEC31